MNGKDKLSRRKFLAKAARLSVGTAIAGSGLTNGVWADELSRRKFNVPDGVEYIESECGAVQESRVLVVYASMYGSTGGIAKAIGEELCFGNAQVDVKYVKNVTDLSSYDSVVVGSAIRGSEWLPEAVDFVKTHRDKLGSIPVGYFLACMSLARPDSPEKEVLMTQRAASWLEPLYEEIPEVKPVGVGLFGGAIHFDKLPTIQRLMYPIIAGNSLEGDFRNWEKIKAWTRDVRPALLTKRTV